MVLETSSFEDFCGSIFWNDTLTWDTAGNATLPDFTICFQHTILVWVPCGFLWLVLPGYLLILKSSKNGTYQSVTVLSAAKSILALTLVGVALYQLGSYISRSSRPDNAVYLSVGLNALSMLLAALLVQFYRLKGQFTSGVLWVYWALWLIGAAVPLYSYCLHVYNDGVIENVSDFSVVCTTFALVLVEFLLSCISDADDETLEALKNVCPEYTSSFSSYITFSWLTPIIVTGYKKSLERTDLWGLGPRDQCENHVPAFEKDWDAAVAEWHAKTLQQKARERVESDGPGEYTGGSDETTPLIRSAKKASEPKLSLLAVILKHYGWLMFVAWLSKFVCDWLKFVDPQIQKQLIEFVTLREYSDAEPVWKGYVLAVGFLLNQMLQTALYQMLWYLSSVCGMQIRAALISIIYKKALKMSTEARQQSMVGEIVNLMAVDAQRIQDATGYVWILWSAPLQIAIALWQLYDTVGPSLFAGFGAMILMMPVNGFVAAKQRNLQIIQMKLKDSRIKMMNEVLGGIKVIKLYAWEPSFEEKVNAIRRKEMDTIRRAWYYRAIQVFGFSTLPFAVTIITFAVFVSLKTDNKPNILTPSIAFVSLSLLNILRGPLNLLPMMISYMAMASVSVKRIAKFFKTTDLSEMNVERDDSAEMSLTIKDGTFTWLPSLPPVLRNVNLEVPTGSLTSIVGTVGTGKSSLLSACVGDMEKLSGRVVVKGSVAFVAQQAWIQNATVKDNILFSHPYNEQKYNQVIEACALRADLDILDNGDQTLIGEKGINLSGGQKQRVSLARAVYADADVYFLDDPLSAVDAHVGKHIFDHVIGPSGLLKDKTRVLVTHGIHWLPMVDNIVVLMNGTVSEVGSYDQLLSHDGPFAQFLKTYFLSDDVDDDEDDEFTKSEGLKDVKKAILERLESVVEEEGDTSLIDKITEKKNRKHVEKQMSKVEHDVVAEKKTPTKPQIPQEMTEAVESGKVAWAVYRNYLSSMGLISSLLSIAGIVAISATNVYSSIWLSQWTDDPVFNPRSNASLADEQKAVDKYLGVYGGLGLAQTLMTLGYTVAFAFSCISASTVLHKRLLSNIMKVQMMFFDTKPLGQILNRFSKDTDVLDNVLGFTILMLFNNSLGVISTVVVIAYSTPVFLIVVLPLIILYYFIQKFFIPTTRQLQRLESVTRSPIYTHFSETITGAQTIRAYRHQERFQTHSQELVEQNLVYFFSGWAANRWLAVRLEFMAAFIVFLTAIFCVLSTQIEYLHKNITASLVGLAITYALNSTNSLNMLIRNLSDLESNIVCVERIKEYSEIPNEAQWENDETTPPQAWPDKGTIQISNYSTRYRPGLDLVLKGISLEIKAGEKIGIVGRTGAGKSSMTLALFRMIEASSGSICIDGINIANIGLHRLRNRITILPQDPVLFSGTIRDNLDPLNQSTDNKIWDVLEQAYLKTYVMDRPDRLNHEVGEGGQNLSVGQRQLVCLARALLRKTKILVLDEATAAVDLETDELIQRTIRSAFADCTVLTIAHRLNTIIDADRVLVLDRGQVAEFDTPDNLLAKEKSVFYAMAKDAGLVKQDLTQ